MQMDNTSAGDAKGTFPRTTAGFLRRLWTAEGPERERGLEELGHRYWKPVYIFIRTAWAKNNEEAKDLAQSFFVFLFERNALKRYDPAKGDFGSF